MRNLRISVPVKSYVSVEIETELSNEELDSERSTCIYDEDHGLISEFKVNE